MNEDELLVPFKGAVDPPPVSTAYRLGLLVVAIAMILLPLVYLSLIAVASYGVYFHAVNNIDIILGGVAYFRLLVYFVPLGAGVILVLFLIKPLFAKSVEIEPVRTLDSSDEPRLFSFVNKLCDVVNAPTPSRIEVDNNVNASAGFHGGVLSIARRRLVLTIGLPLVAGLTLKQFVGVLGHELGHFGQHTGMGLTRIIRGVNYWFARVAFERDRWDEKLGEWMRSEWSLFSLTARLSAFVVTLSRTVLRFLMTAGNAISCYMMRQMELDADTYEAQLVGAETFAATAYQLRILDLAAHAGRADVGEMWRENRVPENLPRLVAVKAESPPAAVRENVEKYMLAATTQILDTHPSDAERSEHAKKVVGPGIFQTEGPATVLFRDFDALCREVTFVMYRQLIGEEVQPHHLVGHDEVLRWNRRGKEFAETNQRFFQGSLDPDGPFFLGTVTIRRNLDHDVVVEQVLRGRNRYEEVLKCALEGQRRYIEGRQRERKALTAERIASAGLPFDPEDFGLSSPSEDEAAERQKQALKIQEDFWPDFQRIRDVTRERLVASLEALLDPQVGGIVREAPSIDTIESWLSTLSTLEKAHPFVDAIQNNVQAIDELMSRANSERNNENLNFEINTLVNRTYHSLVKVRKIVGSAVYPFECSGGDTKLIDYLTDAATFPEFDRVYPAARKLVDGVYGLYFRIIGELATLVERVEEAVGLSRLEAR